MSNTINEPTPRGSQVAGDDNVQISDRTRDSMMLGRTTSSTEEADQLQMRQKESLKEMKKRENTLYKVKMISSVGIAIVTFIVFFTLLKYMPTDGDGNVDNQAGIAPE